jgi:hypothetical protein
MGKRIRWAVTPRRCVKWRKDASDEADDGDAVLTIVGKGV